MEAETIATETPRNKVLNDREEPSDLYDSTQLVKKVAAIAIATIISYTVLFHPFLPLPIALSISTFSFLLAFRYTPRKSSMPIAFAPSNATRETPEKPRIVEEEEEEEEEEVPPSSHGAASKPLEKSDEIVVIPVPPPRPPPRSSLSPITDRLSPQIHDFHRRHSAPVGTGQPTPLIRHSPPQVAAAPVRPSAPVGTGQQTPRLCPRHSRERSTHTHHSQERPSAPVRPQPHRRHSPPHATRTSGVSSFFGKLKNIITGDK